MNYSISTVANLTNLTTHTLRYYEKEGLLNNISRDKNGIRTYNDNDIERINIINCLKATGMTISDIKNYLTLFDKGIETVAERALLFEIQKEEIIKQLDILNKHLNTINYKIWYYKNIEKIGDENDPNNCENMRTLYNKQQQDLSL